MRPPVRIKARRRGESAGRHRHPWNFAQGHRTQFCRRHRSRGGGGPFTTRTTTVVTINVIITATATTTTAATAAAGATACHTTTVTEALTTTTVTTAITAVAITATTATTAAIAATTATIAATTTAAPTSGPPSAKAGELVAFHMADFQDHRRGKRGEGHCYLFEAVDRHEQIHNALAFATGISLLGPLRSLELQAHEEGGAEGSLRSLSGDGARVGVHTERLLLLELEKQLAHARLDPAEPPALLLSTGRNYCNA